MSVSSNSTTSTSTTSNKPTTPESIMSVATPSHIAVTNAWQKEHGIEEEPPLSIGENALNAFLRKYNDENTKTRLKHLDELFETTKGSTIDAACVRNTANWSVVEKHHKFDNPDFDPVKTAEDIKTRSPKLAKILQHIQQLDTVDQTKYGHKFKHFIFSDIKTVQGAKAIAAGLLSAGYTLGYNVQKSGKITAKSEEELRQMGQNNFFLMSSVGIYGEPLRVAVKKDILRKFNLRPDNVRGDLARIIVMDSGFKEGIDLFDVKYVHIFEPQTTAADQKQVIGRGTRTCGQKGLHFNPTLGWPLYVFKYDLTIAPKYRVDFRGAESAFAYYLLSKNIDVRFLRLSSSLEELAIKGSVDYSLNKNIHRFRSNSEVELTVGGDPNIDSADEDERPPEHLRTAEENLLRKLSADSRPGKKYKAVKKYVKKYFSEFKWDKVKMENLCGYEGPLSSPAMVPEDRPRIPLVKAYSVGGDGSTMEMRQNVFDQNPASAMAPQFGGAASTLITMSPTQEFISNYFSAKNPIKGMVLWQSVGTGKTCAAIATATRQFEPLGYTILWVTRTTLKNDIWKNMFDTVCHDGIRDLITAGVTVPENMKDRMRLLSKSWGIRPISYKQFSNLVSKNNQYYDQLVKRNGEEDPLRKTFIIIDEAHKLYGGGDLSSIERPDMAAFHKALMNSYAVSGKDSVRVMLMTATPITEDPLELMKLINLCRPAENQIATDFHIFAENYLDDVGDFTEIGKKLFLDDIAGHLSYLNREGDARQFARPILKEVHVPLVNDKLEKEIADFAVVGATGPEEREVELRVLLDSAKQKYAKVITGFRKSNSAKIGEVCKEYPDEFQDSCEKLVKKYTNRAIKTAKERGSEWNDRVKEFGEELKDIKQSRLQQIKHTRKMRHEYPEKYAEYQKSSYHKLRECEHKWTTTKNLDEFVESQPGYYEAKELEDTIKSELVTVEMRLKSEADYEAARIRSYQRLLKTELRPIETQVVRGAIRDAKKQLDKTRKRNVRWMKRMTRRSDATLKQLTRYQKNAKQMIRSEIKDYVKTAKVLLRDEEKARELEDAVDEELGPDVLASIEDAKHEIRAEIAENRDKEFQKAIKAQLAAETRAANAKVAAEKQAAKAKVAAEKQAAKATMAAEKQAAKATVAAEKQAAKETAAAENRAAKATVAAEKQPTKRVKVKMFIQKKATRTKRV